ncbi:hypothetical protein [Pelagibius sp. Alg239-R121]|uniref:hypothetical protein n=1 Tax=Pelagibius sp. Alg239-R121 TaxID=2993448 RepID=UPI0024A6DD09|nr:hypothetical protein [Pelagibius sp. Alg239-R121]
MRALVALLVVPLGLGACSTPPDGPKLPLSPIERPVLLVPHEARIEERNLILPVRNAQDARVEEHAAEEQHPSVLGN